MPNIDKFLYSNTSASTVTVHKLVSLSSILGSETLIFLSHSQQEGHGAHKSPIGSKVRALSPEVRQPIYESSHLLPHSVQDKNTSSFTFISHYIVKVWSFIKLRGKFCFDPLFLTRNRIK